MATHEAAEVEYYEINFTMQFTISNITRGVNDIMRQIGYIPAYFQNEGEISIVRKLGRNEYPRFHAYIKELKNEKTEELKNGNDLVFNIHLDQKKPSYEGSAGHSGDYDGPVVEAEAERIHQLLKS